MAATATSAPGSPAACQPIKLTIMAFGPGAACAMAKRSRNCAAVIQ